MIELVLDRKVRIQDPSGSTRCFGNQLGKTVVGLRTEHHVDDRRTAHDLRAFSLGNASGDPDDHVAAPGNPLLLELANAAELRIDLLRSLFTDMAGVQDHHVGAFRRRRRRIAERSQDVCHTLRVVDVHLAAVGLYE